MRLFSDGCTVPAVGKTPGFEPEKVNVNGGHRAGASIGPVVPRILVTLLHAMQARDKTLGLATLCIGGAGIAMVIERLNYHVKRPIAKVIGRFLEH